MPEFKRVRLEESGHEVTVAVVGDGMKALDKPAVDRTGRPLPAKPHVRISAAVEELKGRQLDAALVDAGLDTTGTAQVKRERLAEHQAATTTGPIDSEES